MRSKILFRLAAAAALIFVLLLIIVLNPVLTYAGRTEHRQFSIYANHPVTASVNSTLDQAEALIRTSEWYRPGLKLDICLNDGSAYPKVIRALREPAFAWGFYNKVVLNGDADFRRGTLRLNGYRWDLPELLAHEMVHCIQFDKLGLLHSNPVAGIPTWKWEGYAEFISRRHKDQLDLKDNMSRFQSTPESAWAVTFPDSTICPREYFRDWMLVQYCLRIRSMTYAQLLEDTTSEAEYLRQLQVWYRSQCANSMPVLRAAHRPASRP